MGAKELLVVCYMWGTVLLVLPFFNIMGYMLESVFLDHEGAFNYEIEENNVLTNITTTYEVSTYTADLIELTRISGDELVTDPTADGLANGFGFPNISFGYIVTKQYLMNLQSDNVALPTSVPATTCTVFTQTRVMLEVAKYGYLTATVSCGPHPSKEYFIHAARLLPKEPFGGDFALERVTNSIILDHLQEPAKIGIENKNSDLDQMDGFVVVDLDKYLAYAKGDPVCSQKLGAFGGKKTFCPVACSKEEGVSFVTWGNTILEEIEVAHTLRSFHKVNMFLFGTIYSSDSCTAGRSIGIDPVRPVGLADRPQFHVGCEEIYTEHWIVPLLYYSLFAIVLITTIPYLAMLLRVTSKLLSGEADSTDLLNVDFASGICNKKSFYFPLFVMSLRQMAVIHALCIATAINGPGIGTVIFGISQTLPFWGLTMLMSVLQPQLRKYKGLVVGEYTIYLRMTATAVITSFAFLYTIWLTAYNNDIRNLYLGGYPVVQSIIKISGASRTVDPLRNIGMYQKWTSLGVYNMLSSPESGLAELLVHWILLILVLSIRVSTTESLKQSTSEDDEGMTLSEYERRIQIEGHTTGKGFYGDSFADFTIFKNIRYSTVNCQLNDGFYVYGKILVTHFGTLGLLFAHKLGLGLFSAGVKAYGSVKGATLTTITEEELAKRKHDSTGAESEGLRVTNIS